VQLWSCPGGSGEPPRRAGVLLTRRRAIASTDRKNPGDEDAPGTKQTGENICPTCNGSGRLDQKTCPDCDGSGMTVAIIGDA
jgi:RecJ-like exonuclease